MGLWPNQGDEKLLGPATTSDRVVALSFVIPRAPACRGSEADLSRLPRLAVGRGVEGSAVPRTFRGNAFRDAAWGLWSFNGGPT